MAEIQFKKYLPSIMQQTRWGTLIDVWQEIVYNNIKTNIVEKIINQYDIDLMDETDIQGLFQYFGYNCLTLTGYTETFDFIKKELFTLVPRIQKKSTQDYFILQGIPFNLISNAYNLYYDTINNNYIPNLTNEYSVIYGTEVLDREHYYLFLDYIFKTDQNNIVDFDPIIQIDNVYAVEQYQPIQLSETYLDEYNFNQLDSLLYITQITKNILFIYYHKYVENENEFLSENTLKSLVNDINQFKKLTDRIYYTPELQISINQNKELTIQPLYNYQLQKISSIKSILISDDLNSPLRIRFGKGAHTTIDTSITDVFDFYFEKSIENDCFIIEQENNTLSFILKIEELQHFDYITEFILINKNNNAMVYVTFPKIQWLDNMYSSIKIIINVTNN